MAEFKRFENLEKAMCRELDALDSKCATGAELSDKELERADKIMHYLKSGETYFSMKEANAYDERYGGMSGARNRSYRTGRYISRDYPEERYSGHWSPMEYIDPYYDRR